MFENVTRFSDPNYEPSTQDVLRARSRTTGIDEAEFHFNDIDFRLIDVGGQRSERRKWIRCFDCVTAVIFCISMSEYDQYLREDPSQVRPHRLLHDILAHAFVRTAPASRFCSSIKMLKVHGYSGHQLSCFSTRFGSRALLGSLMCVYRSISSPKR